MARNAGRMVVIASLALAACSCDGSAPGPGPEAVEPPHEITTGFVPAVDFTTDSPGIDLLTADLDDNGRVDLVIPLVGGGVKVVYNFSNPGQVKCDSSRAVESSERNLRDVAIGDYDKDGKLDLFLLDSGGYIEVRGQNDNGGFSPLCQYRSYGSKILVDQVNTSDDTLDMLFAYPSDADILALYQNPAGGVYPEDGWPASIWGGRDKPEDALYSEMSLTDFDANGLMDMVLAEELSNLLQIYVHVALPIGNEVINPDTGEVEKPRPGVFYGNQSVWYDYTRFELPWLGSESNEFRGVPKRLAFDDIDQDGVKDIAVLCDYWGVIPEQPGKLDTGHLNVEPPKNVIWLLQSSITPRDSGSEWEIDNTEHRAVALSAVLGLTYPNIINDVKLADVNKDGEVDVLGCCDGSGEVGFSFFCFSGLGNFEFDAPVGFSLADPPLRLVAEDFDGDEYLDVAVLLPTINAISIFLNDSNTGLGDSGIQYVFLDE